MPPKFDFEVVKNQVFENQNIVVSGRRFQGCILKECNLVYLGSPFYLDDTILENCAFISAGPVHKALVGIAPKEIVDSLIADWNDVLRRASQLYPTREDALRSAKHQDTPNKASEQMEQEAHEKEKKENAADLDIKRKYFAENYQLEFQYRETIGVKKTNGDGAKGCRFCGGQNPPTTFHNIAHTFPEFLGSHNLFQADECDGCNKIFSSSFEDHLDKFTKAWRVFNRIKGKKGVPSYRSRDQKFRIENAQNRFVLRSMGSVGAATYDAQKKLMKLTFQIEPYIPARAYKAVMKMALSVMPLEDLNGPMSNNLDLLLDDPSVETPFPLFLMETQNPSKQGLGFEANLYKKKTDVHDITYYFQFSIGTHSYQIALPSNEDRTKGKFKVSWVPTEYYEGEIEGMGARYAGIDMRSVSRRPPSETVINMVNHQWERID